MTTENVKQAIELLESINPSDEYCYEKALLAYLKIKLLPILVYRIPAGTPIFRTRTHEDNNLFDKISDISLPPTFLIKYFARCNRPFQSKFYCSENRPTSYMELVQNWVETKKSGEKVYVTIGRWVLKNSLAAIIVTTPDEEKRISDFDKHHGSAIDKFINDCTPEIREATILFYRYLFEKFRKPAKNDPKTYIITTAYCNLALAQTKGNTNGIYYPSVPFGEQGVNFAINTDFATFENLELTHIIRNEMTVKVKDDGKHSFTESEIISAGKFNLSQNLIEW